MHIFYKSVPVNSDNFACSLYWPAQGVRTEEHGFCFSPMSIVITPQKRMQHPEAQHQGVTLSSILPMLAACTSACRVLYCCLSLVCLIIGASSTHGLGGYLQWGRKNEGKDCPPGSQPSSSSSSFSSKRARSGDSVVLAYEAAVWECAGAAGNHGTYTLKTSTR